MFAVITCFYHRQKCVCAHAARALPFPFGRKRKQKGPKRPSRRSLVHGTSAATRLSHERTRSAKLPKLNASRRFKHMGSFVFALSPCKAAHVEPRRRRSALLPWPSVSVSVDEGLAWELFWDFNHRLRNNILCAKIGFTKQICVENRLRLK